MYTILIADDEKIERNGIKSLISRFSFPLDVVEARNGKEALEYLKANPVDILFTDIKMPFMDGLELSKHARALIPDLKIIIFSAYGEFEYAKKAIGLNVIHYILKPIDIGEFQSVVSKVIQLCKEVEEARRNQEEIQLVYEKGIAYEKEKLLFQLLNSQKFDSDLKRKAASIGLDFCQYCIRMLLIDCSQRFFDTNGSEFESVLNSLFKCNFYILSLNERQSLIFFRTSLENKLNMQEFTEVGKKLMLWICEKSQSRCFIIAGRTVDDIEGISSEYSLLEQVLEYKFFIEESKVLRVEDYLTQNMDIPAHVNMITERIYKMLEIRDYGNVEQHIEELFNCIKNNGGLNSVYVKHIFIEIIRKMFVTDEKNNIEKFRGYMNAVNSCSNLSNLKDILASVLNDINRNTGSNNDETNRRVIEKVYEIISNEYANDIGVEYIADMVYLSPNYLGQLFKKHTGKNLTRYIMEYRMSRAKEFLAETNLKITDIAEKTGFTNKSYFTLIFKNYFGITPAQYREKIG